MTAKSKATPPAWDDDDIPEWDDDAFDTAQINDGSKVIRPATGVLTKNGVKRVQPFIIPIPGRPRERDEAKKQVTLRLDADVLARFREGGKGWQTRLNATLRKAVGM